MDPETKAMVVEEILRDLESGTGSNANLSVAEILPAIVDMDRVREEDGDGLRLSSAEVKLQGFLECYRGALEKRRTGHYEIHRFRNMHLLSLRLYEEEIMELEREVDKILRTIPTSRPLEKRWRPMPALHAQSGQHTPETASWLFETKMSRLREVLKEHSEEMLVLNQLMQLKTASYTEAAELNHQPKMDPLRALFTRNIFSLAERREQKALQEGRSYSFAFERAMRIADILARFLIAMLGGAALIVPIVLMTFLKSRDQHLIITSVFTVGFALGTSVIATASNQKVLAATAAYAAVLVVFMGTSLATT